MRRTLRIPSRSKIRNSRLRSQHLKQKSQNEHRTTHATKGATKPETEE